MLRRATDVGRVVIKIVEMSEVVMMTIVGRCECEATAFVKL
jgi:hypothetical protein